MKVKKRFGMKKTVNMIMDKVNFLPESIINFYINNLKKFGKKLNPDLSYEYLQQNKNAYPEG